MGSCASLLTKEPVAHAVMERPVLTRSEKIMNPTKRLAAVLAGALTIGLPAVTFAETVIVRLDSYEEVPSVSSGASGHFRALIEDRAPSIAYELSYEGLEGDVRQAHIHVGQAGANGGISVFLCQTVANPDPTGLAPSCPQSGTVTGTITPANVIGPTGQGVAVAELDELIAAIRAGVAYVNVHSVPFQNGEIRGQLH